MTTNNGNNNRDQMAANSIRGNNTGSIALSSDLTVAQTNTLLGISGIGTAAVGQIPGATTNTTPSAGNLGEFIISQVLTTSPVNIPTSTGTTGTNITSINLTAGNWLVLGNIHVFANSGTGIAQFYGWQSTVSSTVPDLSFTATQYPAAGSSVPQGGVSVPAQRYSFATTTTVYLVTFLTFATGTVSGSGYIFGIRI